MHQSILEWIDGLSPDDLNRFIPEDSRIELREQMISNPRLAKILARFRDRINMDHGAMFAISDSVNVIKEQLDALFRSVSLEPPVIRSAFQRLVVGTSDPISLDVPPETKAEYRVVLAEYKKFIHGHSLTRDPQAKAQMIVQENKFEQAMVKGGLLDLAIQYHASRLFSVLKLLQERRNEAVSLFAEIAKRHFTSEEIIMANLVNDLSRFGKHLAAHDSALATFDRYLNVSPDGPLKYEKMSQDLKEISVTINKWLVQHIKGNDLVDYGEKLSSRNPEYYFSIKERPIVIDSERLQGRWNIGKNGVSSVQQYLLKCLNSEKVFF